MPLLLFYLWLLLCIGCWVSFLVGFQWYFGCCWWLFSRKWLWLAISYDFDVFVRRWTLVHLLHHLVDQLTLLWLVFFMMMDCFHMYFIILYFKVILSTFYLIIPHALACIYVPLDLFVFIFVPGYLRLDLDYFSWEDILRPIYK